MARAVALRAPLRGRLTVTDDYEEQADLIQSYRALGAQNGILISDY